jgi:hypothetical protein
MYVYVYAGICRYLQVCTGICLYVNVSVEMLDILLHLLISPSSDGSVVHGVTCAPDDGCSSSRRVKAVLL